MPGAAEGRGPNGPKRKRPKDPDLVRLGERVKAIRKASGATQAQVEEASDLARTYVGQVERGERNLRYTSILRLAAGLGTEPAQLLED